MIVGRVEEDDAGHPVWVARSEECRLDTSRGDADKMNPLDRRSRAPIRKDQRRLTRGQDEQRRADEIQ
jgi:hypothetical protein